MMLDPIPEYIRTFEKLTDAKADLQKLKDKESLKKSRKKLRSISTSKEQRIENYLSKMECHLNVIQKHSNYQSLLIYHLVKSRCNYDEDTIKKWWKNYSDIYD